MNARLGFIVFRVRGIWYEVRELQSGNGVIEISFDRHRPQSTRRVEHEKLTGTPERATVAEESRALG